MAVKKLDLSALEKAVKSLERAVVRSQQNLGDEELRDAVIQRFEYTFELCWKMLKRQLELEVPTSAELDTFSYRQLIREAAERALIDHPDQWFVYRDQRNNTVHTYDQEKANSVYASVLDFLPEAKKLLDVLKKRQS